MESNFIICQSEIAMKVKDIIAIVPKKENVSTEEPDTDLWELYASMSNGHVLLMSKHVPGNELHKAVVGVAYAVQQTYDSCPPDTLDEDSLFEPDQPIEEYAQDEFDDTPDETTKSSFTEVKPKRQLIFTESE